MTHHILVTAVGSDRHGLVQQVTETVTGCGCNIAESRMTTMGAEFVILMLVNGNWHTLGKLEKELEAVGKATGLQVAVRRTEARPAGDNLLPYAVDLVSLDQPGIVTTLATFFAAQNIAIFEMSTRSYAAAHTGAPMFNLQMVISVPSTTHIASLREDFMELCDQYNLDAILEPVKN